MQSMMRTSQVAKRALKSTRNQKNGVKVSKPILAGKQNYGTDEVNDENAAPVAAPTAPIRIAAPVVIEEVSFFVENLSDRIKKRGDRKRRQIDKTTAQSQQPATKKAKVQAPKVAKVAEEDIKKAVIQIKKDEPTVRCQKPATKKSKVEAPKIAKVVKKNITKAVVQKERNKPAVKKAVNQQQQRKVEPKYRKLEKCTYSAGIKKENHTAKEICNCLAEKKNCSDLTCLNRASNTECPPTCPVENCENQRFAKKNYAKVEEFQAGARGFGVKATRKIKKGDFIIEYVGHVLDDEKFASKKSYYTMLGNTHHYFFYNGKYTIDATRSGNLSRLINHCCEPNSSSQKWLVPGTPQNIPHIGLFAVRDIEPGEEITFDYQFEVYGLAAQQCHCGSASCKGTIGSIKPTKTNRE